MNSDANAKGRAFSPAAGRSAVPPDTTLHHEDESALDLVQLLRALWRGKWIILALALIGSLIAGYYAFEVAQPRYTAQTRLTFEVRDQPDLNLNSVVSGVSTEQASINTELQILRSRKLLTRVVDQLGLVNDPEFNTTLQTPSPFSVKSLRTRLSDLITGTSSEAGTPAPSAQKSTAIGNLAAAVSVVAVRNTYIFNILVKTSDPQKSALIANTLAQVYLDEQINVKFAATEHAVTWLSERVNALEDDLRRKEDEIKDLRGETELISVESLDALRIRAKELRDRISDAETALITDQTRFETARRLQADDDFPGLVAHFNDPSLQRIGNGLTGDNDPGKAVFDARVTALLDRETLLLDRAFSQKQALDASYQRTLTQIDEQNADLLRLNQMEREADATRVLYESFLARLKEASVQVGLQQADSRVFSEAITGRYVSPQKPRIVMVGFVLGLLLGSAIVIIRELVRDGIRSGDELERVSGTPVLGQIPSFPIKRRSDLLAYLRNAPTSAANESIRNLRTSVLLSNIDDPPKVIMVTSSVPGEGKTTLSISLAHNLAQLDKRVLLIEADIRRRTFQEYFKAAPEGGLVSVVAGSATLEQTVLKEPTIGIDILMGEKSSVNAADLFSSERFEAFLQRVRNQYDVIIIDTPPILVVPDARVVGRHADAIVYVVKWDKTTAPQIRDGQRQLSGIGLTVSGTALSQIDPKGMRRYGYGNRYGAYSRYGRGYYDA